MTKTMQTVSTAAAIVAATAVGVQVFAQEGEQDFGRFVQRQLERSNCSV